MGGSVFSISGCGGQSRCRHQGRFHAEDLVVPPFLVLEGYRDEVGGLKRIDLSPSEVVARAAQFQVDCRQRWQMGPTVTSAALFLKASEARQERRGTRGPAERLTANEANQDLERQGLPSRSL